MHGVYRSGLPRQLCAVGKCERAGKCVRVQHEAKIERVHEMAQHIGIAAPLFVAR